MRRLAVFDLDGTLFKGAEVSFPAYDIIADEFGIERPSKELVLTFFGRTFDFVAAALNLDTGEGVKSRFIKRIEELESESLRSNGTLYDGALELIERLHGDGIATAICSMGVKSYVEAVLEKTGLDRYVRFVRFDNGVDDKPQMLKSILEEAGTEKAVMVGDRSSDWEAAEFAGVPFIGCSYGYAPHEVADSPKLTASPGEIYGLITELIN